MQIGFEQSNAEEAFEFNFRMMLAQWCMELGKNFNNLEEEII